MNAFAAPGAWESRVEQAISDLKTLNASTERDFLAVGGKLMEFRAATREISSQMTALIEGVSGTGGEDRALARMLDDSTRRDGQIADGNQALESVRVLSQKVHSAFARLRETVSTFRTLCTLTRIETSRLGDSSAAFGLLADAVKPLSESIEASGEVIWSASLQLETSVNAALKRCSGLQAQQQSQLTPLISGLTEALSTLEERRERAYQASLHQSGQYREIGEAIKELVTSLQTHDITRQQVEHVTEALVVLLPRDGQLGSTNAQVILALQGRQLLSAGQAFAASMHRIETDLDNIGTRTREMAEASRALMKAPADEPDSFVEKMDHCFKAILAAAEASNRERLEMETTASSVEVTIDRMSAATSEIQLIEIQIQRIAINAAIGAIHIGSPGCALSLIAEVMQGLAQESNENTEMAAGALKDMSTAVRRVSGRESGISNSPEANPTNAIAAMRDAFSELHQSSRSSSDRAIEIAASGRQLSEAIEVLQGGLTARRVFVEVADRVRSEIDMIAQNGSPLALQEENSTHAQELDRLAENYTMQAERDVHNAVLNRMQNVASPAEVSLGDPTAEHDLGDNVDLF